MSKVKICGLQSLDDIALVNEFLPDYGGFIFAESSRKILPLTASRLRDQLDNRVEVVGVFVNQEVDFIVDLFRSGVINHIQLHGDETSSYIADLRKVLGDKNDYKIIKAYGVKTELPTPAKGIDFALYDSATLQRGGSGTSFDWTFLEEYAGLPFFLAGGLDITNITQALDLLSPYCVDVSSGVETDGVKDRQKIREFIAAVRKEAR